MKALKKTFLALAAGLLLAAPVMTPAAQAADLKVGVVDVQKIFNGSKLITELNEAQKAVADAEKRLADEYQKRVKELAEKQSTLKEEEIVQLKRRFEDEMNAMKKTEEDKLVQKREAISKIKTKLEADLTEAVKKVAGQKGLELVISKQLVIYGGQDITQAVLEALPK